MQYTRYNKNSYLPIILKIYFNDAININNKNKVNITPGNVRIGNTTTLRDRVLTLK